MKSVQRYHLSCFVVLLLCLTVVPAVAAQYRYQEQKGKEITAVTVTREKQGNLLRTEISKNDVTTVSFNDPGGFGATSHWQLNIGTTKSYSVIREKNFLTISGKAEGEPHENTAGLDDKPWLQDLGYSFAKFIKTPHRDLFFWTIQEGALEPTLLMARKRGSETITLNGQSVVTQKIEISSNDIFLKLWRAFYWFRDNDGLLIQYRSDPGIPGMSVTVGTLIESLNN